MNVEPFIKAKSDQLNADDLIGGSITVRIEAVNKGSADQPVVVKISNGHQPWKPCKTSLRILVATMGKDTTQWVGHSVELYRDPKVKWAGVEVGGIRIRALSCIEKPKRIPLTETKGQKREYEIQPLKAPAGQLEAGSPPPAQPGPTLNEHQAADLAALLDEMGAEFKSKWLAWKKIEKPGDLPASDYDDAIKGLEKKRGQS